MSIINYREDQIPIINYKGGTMAVPAVPGAGKTFIVTNLVAKLIEEKKHKPGKILILTYMNSAVNNFKGRIGKILQERDIKESNSYEVMTIHSLAVKIIKEKPDTVMLNEEFSIVDDLKKYLILNECIQNWRNNGGDRIFKWFLKEQKDAKWIQISYESWEKGFFDVVSAIISDLKYKDISPQVLKEIAWDDNNYKGFLRCIAPIYYEYDKKLKSHGLLDYDDLLILGYKALKSDTALREKFQKRYTYIFEDECQDSNEIQGKILKLIYENNNNIVRVGDVNQSINGTFSSSDPKFFKEFMKKADVCYKMDMSNRSSKDIIELANNLVTYVRSSLLEIKCKDALQDMNIRTVPKGMGYKENPEPSKYGVNYKWYKSWEDEIIKTVKNIKWIKENYKDKSIGILVPYNSQIKEVGEILTNENIEFDELSSSSAQRRKVINYVGYILDFIHNCYDIEKLLWVLDKIFINTDNKISREELLRFLGEYTSENILYDLDNILENIGIDPNEEIYKDLVNGVNTLRDILEYPSIKIDEFVLYIGSKLDINIQEKAMVDYLSYYVKYLSLDNLNMSIKDVYEILLDDRNRVFNYISDIIYEMNGYEPKPGGITVCTYHKSKGMEWDCVFLLDLTDFKFPDNTKQKFQGEHWYLKDKWKNPVAIGKSEIDSIITGDRHEDYLEKHKIEIINEKIRLLYVGITRAKEFLILSGHELNNQKKKQNPCIYYRNLSRYINIKRGEAN
jgi:DNA helicase-2/ATP-dependent DNA helicase PcrA